MNTSESSNVTEDHLSLKEPRLEPGQRKTPAGLVLVPFFLSALLYWSTVLTVFAPLPLIVFFFTKGKGLSTLAVFTNAVLVFALGGLAYLAIYLVFVAVPVFVLPSFLVKKKSAEKSVVWSLFFMVVMGLVIAFAMSRYFHLNLAQEYTRLTTRVVDEIAQTLSGSAELMESGELDEWKQNLRVEIPSAVIIVALVILWSNLNLLLSINPKGLRDFLGLDAHYFKKWKAPESLVWPTIASGFALVFDWGWVSDVGTNVFRVLMAIYAFQGLSILGSIFDLWGIRGLFRFLGYFLSVFVMMPLVLGLGFFDLWFDFRSKFRQS